MSDLSTRSVRVSLSSSMRGSFPLSVDVLQKLAVAACSFAPGLVRRCAVDVRFVGDRRIRSLNRRWRGKDLVTDVLSFPQLETADPSVSFPEISSLSSSSNEEVLLGDLLLCVPQARRQAKRKGLSVREELAWMFTHGFLHLLGMDHQTDVDEQHMEAIERKTLAVVFG